MPQFRAGRRRRSDDNPEQPEINHQRNAARIREGIDVGEWHTDLAHQIERLGYDRVRKIAAQNGLRPPKDRTLRRWKQHNRVPAKVLSAEDTRVSSDVLSVLLRRADEVERLGGVAAAAETWGRSESTVRAYLRSPKRSLKIDAQQRAAEADRADRWTAAGIPHRAGQVTQGAWIKAKGDAHIRGAAPSAKRNYSYDRPREVSGYRLSIPTTQTILEARDRGDAEAARWALEEWLGSDGYAADLEGKSEEHGWTWTNLEELELSFDNGTQVSFFD